jgi:competence protein ComEC
MSFIMFRLQTGLLVSIIITGIVIVVGFLTSLPDGKLHVVFCDVGQGDSAYIRFPDGRDMIIDGGPDKRILNCLSRHMPFWDRTVDIVELTHPQKDHMDGLLEVLKRYDVKQYIHSDVTNETDGFRELTYLLDKEHSKRYSVTAGSESRIGQIRMAVLWPSASVIAMMKPIRPVSATGTVLGAVSIGNVNDASIVLKLSYGTFDVLFTGDADNRVDDALVTHILPDPDGLEVLKVPHHGSKTGMTEGLLKALSPGAYGSPRCAGTDVCPLAVISVGRNTYGHPGKETLEGLRQSGFRILRTDQVGDVEIVTDGRSWSVKTQR